MFAPNAVVLVAQAPRLCTRVRRELLGILEASAAVWPSVPWARTVTPDDFLCLRIGGYSITYTLDLERKLARVLSATPLHPDDDAVTAA
ncbi:MAG TPA: hypothetical protein VGH20_07585 [Myxococcales bacterium]